MLFNSILKTALVTLASIAKFSQAAELPAIEIGGNKFFFSNNGSQFYVKGVAYQSDNSGSEDLLFVDPLADEETCRRDIPYLQELNTNVVRVYAINASLDHGPCMELLNDAGIYVIADLSEPGLSIITDSPAWDLELYNRYTQVVDMFSNYTNVLGFFAGNEVITNSTNTGAAPFIKAAIRDTKQYISDQGYRDIPVGYSANDDSETRIRAADYFACGDEDIRADFYGVNMYSWCGDSTFEESGYAARTEEFSNLSIPIFFSEYGCNRVQPREFTEVQALYGPNMTDVWSGGIVYMYFQETNDYGLVSTSGMSVSTLTDFNNLRSQLAQISPSSATYESVTATATDLSCPHTDRFWAAVTSLPPSPERDVCDCLYESLGCVVSEDIDEDDYADLFSYVCSEVDCSDINANGTTGNFGDYSFCSSRDKLSYVLNLYYLDQDSSSSACSFDGSASLKSTTEGRSCSRVLAGLTLTGSSSSSTSTSDSDDDDSSSSSSSSSSRSTSSSGSSSSSSSTASSSSSSSAGLALKPSVGNSELVALALSITCIAGGFSFLFI